MALTPQQQAFKDLYQLLLIDNITEEITPEQMRQLMEHINLSRAVLGLDGKILPEHLPDNLGGGIPSGGSSQTVLFGDGWKNFADSVRQVQPAADQTSGIEEYDPLVAYTFPHQVKYSGRIWDAKLNVPAGQAPPTLAATTENTYWRELSPSHVQNTDTAMRLANGTVVTADNLANLESIVPANRRDPNFLGEPGPLTRYWQWISILERKIGELYSGNNITIAGNKIFSGLVRLKTVRFDKISATLAGGTYTADLSQANVFVLTLEANTALAVSNIQDVSTAYFYIRNTGNFTLTFPAAFRFSNNNVPAVTQGNGKRDLITCMGIDDSGMRLIAAITRNV
jgi:hypothetical protein